MTKVFIDSALSIDGFWADRDGQSVFPVGDMHRSGPKPRLFEPWLTLHDQAKAETE